MSEHPTFLDWTHDPALQSWVPSANEPGTDFPVQNLPYARFRRAGSDEPLRVGVAIGDQVLDLKIAAEIAPWGDGIPALLQPLADGDLAGFMNSSPEVWRAVRHALVEALTDGSVQGPFLETALVPQTAVQFALPCAIGDYTDFYIGIHHARAVGKLFRPDNPLLPNYTWVPIGYHGRASSIVLSGTPVRRPLGQLKPPEGAPVLAPTKRLDHELELGLLIGRGNPLGARIGIDTAEQHLFGVVLLNDWSSRDVQGWEYQPLGPFLSKNFSTSISPWVVTLDALAPFRRPLTRPEGDPPPLPYLDSPANRTAGSFAITLEAWLQTAAMAKAQQGPERLMQSRFDEAAYWTPAQLITHHTVGGCNLGTGDLLGTGTLSGPGEGQGGSLLELTQGGKVPLRLASGEQRTFLEDGDTLELRAHCEAPDARRIGFGVCRGTVLPAAV